MKYIYTINRDPEHLIHIHIIMSGGISRDEINRVWKKGNIHAQMLEQNEAAKKQGEIKKSRMWIPSKGLIQPQEYWCVPNRRLMRIAREEYAVKENCDKYFPSYTYQRHDPYNSIIRGYNLLFHDVLWDIQKNNT